MNTGFLRHAVATVLTVYGIETASTYIGFKYSLVATVLTVYGIETLIWGMDINPDKIKLQQCLPFTVLKHMLRLQHF